jgi:hypothetical protein
VTGYTPAEQDIRAARGLPDATGADDPPAWHDQPDTLSKALMKSRPELAGHVHYLDGHPWCDGVNHTTMCQPEFEGGAL